MERIFLLGGHDLEMMEIKRLLILHGERFADAELDWNGARLSAYLPLISDNPDSDYYGIELQEDCSLPNHYTRIDHHNDYSNRPATILQVAEILGITPDRHVQLVAANDAGYIPAMLELSASEEEIAEIRKLDRAAQGVSEEDEHLAEKSINERLQRYGSLIVVKSMSPKFSPICDSLYPYNKLFIYTDDEWMYYGEGKAEIAVCFSNEIEKRRIFHGGSKDGYIGCVKGAYNKSEIEEITKNIIYKYGNQ